MRYLERLSILLNVVLLTLGGVAVLALMCVATGNVVLRIFHIPFRGAYEIVSFLGAIVIAFALGYTQQRKSHIIVDILTEKFPRKLVRFLDAVSHFVTMVFFGTVSWQIYRWGMKIGESGELSETLKIVYHPFIFAVSLGFATLSLTALVQLIADARGGEEQ